MRVKGLKLHDVVTALEEAGYYVDELYADADDDQVIDVYADEDSQRVLEMTFKMYRVLFRADRIRRRV